VRRIILLIPLLNFLSLFILEVALAACPPSVAGRFVLKNDEAFDTKTGLTWKRCSVGMVWKDHVGCTGQRAFIGLTTALKAAKDAGRGWRVPDVKELYGLIENECGAPPLNVIAFPDLRQVHHDPDADANDTLYWTTSQFAAANLAYYVDLYTGNIDAHSRGFSLAVRLVRSGS
jgi:hypothetical protein